MSERDELSMYIWQNLINSLSSIIEYPPSSNEDFEGNFFSYKLISHNINYFFKFQI